MLTREARSDPDMLGLIEGNQLAIRNPKVEPSPTKNSASICFGIFDEKICLPGQC
jgi:hypothetical protein